MTAGIKANADGSAAIQVGGSDAITISAALDTTFVGTATVPTGTLYPLVRGTAVASTSGTSIDFTSIPSWVKRITVMFSGVSLNGSANILVQIGSGSVTTSGYVSSSGTVVNASGSSGSTSTAGFISSAGSAGNIIYGHMVITNITSNTWVESHYHGYGVAAASTGGGTIALGGVLDRVRITTTNGTDTFDAGSINILYE
jgi:hypothetical protein